MNGPNNNVEPFSISALSFFDKRTDRDVQMLIIERKPSMVIVKKSIYKLTLRRLR